MKTVLITGANKGIDLETARQLLKQGHFVYLGSRSKGNGLKAEEELRAEGLYNVEAIELDVTVLNSVIQAKARLEDKLPALDILINNAGIAGIQPPKKVELGAKVIVDLATRQLPGTSGKFFGEDGEVPW